MILTCLHVIASIQAVGLELVVILGGMGLEICCQCLPLHLIGYNLASSFGCWIR
jgi:hypothetical protein